ncbi:MAG: VWA domain-containing protein [Chloroflexi bacterium]|nr:VWA domain-containing protein [Chloroflexota bacterium]
MHNFSRYLTHAALLFSAITLAGFGPPMQAEEPAEVRITQVDTSNFPRVTVYISSVDSEGNPVPIDPSRLQLAENGEAIPLDQIEGMGEVGPLTTLLVMDVSGSMNSGGKLDSAKAAARAYVEQMRPGDQAGLLVFNTQATYIQAITSDHALLLDAIDSMRAQDNTAMFDALNEAVGILEPVSGRKAIIVLTDGLDNVSQATPDAVIERIGPAGLSISTVGLGVPGQGRGALTALDEEALRGLAANAGGVYGYAEDEDSLQRLYQTYAIAMQSEYVITYTSPAALHDGVNRALTVSLASPAGAADAGAPQAVYNPGGLVPEVAQPAPWPVFAAMLAVLAGLLLLPILAGALGGVFGGLSGAARRGFRQPKARVKLKD